MKILVVSDSHGKGNLLNHIVEQVKPDHMIHCGDFCTDLDELPKISMTLVRGNCDWEDVPEEQVWEKDGIRFFVTHGHNYRVNSSPLALRYRGEEAGADIVCFGHTHYPFCEQDGPVILINPGSIAQPRGFAFPTYAVVQMEGKDKIRVRYYQVDGTAVPERGGLFSL
jgi:uncharacterized protein